MANSFNSSHSQLHPELSLGSLNSSLSTGPARRSTMSGSTAAHNDSSTPDEDPTKTPVAASKPGLHRRRSSAATGKSGVNLTLREQEKVIDSLKKENFSLKLKVHFLEERLQENNPEHVELALKQNINLKIEVQARGVEIKRLKKQLREYESRPPTSASGTTCAESHFDRERELEALLDEREREMREMRRRKGGVGPGDATEALHAELENARAVMEENVAELERLRDEVDALREEKDALQEEKDALLDELDGARLEVEGLQRAQEGLSAERSASRAEVYEERLGREALEEEVNALRDRLAATEIELQTKEDELEARDAELDRVVDTVEGEWRQEMEETRGQLEDLRDANAELEAEVADLRHALAEREDECGALRADLADLEADARAVNAELENFAQAAEELEAANAEIKRLGERVFELEDEVDCVARERDDARVELEREQGIAQLLKDRLAAAKDAARDARTEADANRESALAHAARETELAQHAAELAADLQQLQGELRALEADVAAAESARQRAEDEREAVRAALMRTEQAAGDKFALELELETVRREVTRLTADLERIKAELEDKERRLRDKEAQLDRAAGEAREAAAREAAAAQARMNLSEKLDAAQAALKQAERDRERVAELEARMGKDQRALLNAEGTFRDQISERNTLLLTVWGYLDKVLGAAGTPKKAQAGSSGTAANSSTSTTTKPFTNFAVFNEGLLARLKALASLHGEFEKRVKEAEARLADRAGELRRTLDARWRTVERLEGSVKALAEHKAAWRRRLLAAQGELEGARASIAELTSQLSSKDGGKARSSAAHEAEVRALTARATMAERRLVNAQNQLASTEERVAAQAERAAAADGKWEARVREYEARIRAAEERVKRERQGAKERVGELENAVKSLQRQVEIAKERQRRMEKDKDKSGGES